jgi:hypothetical protein
MISHAHRCIFIHIPKCAGSSIERALGQADHGPNEPDHRSIRMLEQPALTWPALAKPDNLYQLALRVRHDLKPNRNPLNKLKLTREQYASYFKFTIVRNPWTRVFSWYGNCVGRPELRKRFGLEPTTPFDVFIRERLGKGALRPQLTWLRDSRGRLPIDFIGRFETLQRDFEAVCARLQITAAPLPHARKGGGADYREHYDDHTRALVAQVYAEEIELFGYRFDDFADLRVTSPPKANALPASTLSQPATAGSVEPRRV